MKLVVIVIRFFRLGFKSMLLLNSFILSAINSNEYTFPLISCFCDKNKEQHQPNKYIYQEQYFPLSTAISLTTDQAMRKNKHKKEKTIPARTYSINKK